MEGLWKVKYAEVGISIKNDKAMFDFDAVSTKWRKQKLF